jgi:hypothetical protein
MSITIKTKYYVIAILTLTLALFFGGWWYGAKRANDDAEVAQTALKHEITTLTVQLNDTEYTLTKTEQELISERELRKQDIFEKKELKALNLKQVNEISKLQFRIDTLLEDVNHTGEIVIIHDTITKEPKNALLLPFTFGKQDEWLDFKGRFDDKGKLAMALKMNVAVDVISGFEKKTGKPTLNVLSDNPYLNTIDIRSWKTDAQKSTRYGLGIQIGYGFILGNPVKTAPYIGVGGSYNFIRF